MFCTLKWCILNEFAHLISVVKNTKKLSVLEEKRSAENRRREKKEKESEMLIGIRDAAYERETERVWGGGRVT